jgi:isopentenyl diphosphate isomerase/L-lactate dehydrogenase-like FMN-dependent dehydrogenase
MVLVFTVDLPTSGRRYSAVHDGMEKDPTLLGMLGFVAQGATHPRWALDIVTKGWPLKFGTVAAAAPKTSRLENLPTTISIHQPTGKTLSGYGRSFLERLF